MVTSLSVLRKNNFTQAVRGMIFGGYHLPRLQTKERAGAWQKEKKKKARGKSGAVSILPVLVLE